VLSDTVCTGGGGGSNGSNGLSPSSNNYPGTGGAYGGGGASNWVVSNVNYIGKGSDGAIRIIWGTGRSFPSTNTGDV
jgi:hypothetical protein